MRKRLLSALVALCMALTLMPSWAFAENEGIPEPSGNEVIEGLQEEGAKDSPQESGEDGAKDLQKPEENGAEDPLQKPEEDSAGNPLQENQEDGAKDSLQEPEEDGAQNPQPPLEEAEEISLSADLSGLPELDNDALFDRLVSQMLGLEPSAAPAPRKARAAGRAAAFTLNAGEQALYNAILRHATSLTKPSGSVDSPKLDITAADRVVYSDVITTTDEGNSFTSRVFPALMQDHPELFFWFDRHSFETGGITFRNDNGYFVGTLNMKVTAAYRKPDGDEFTFDKTLLDNVQEALNTAQEIVSDAASLDDVGKLEAYRDAVCRMTSYNHAAAGNGGSAEMGEDPWQIIWVFDNDEDTKVVCEGYSKAFQYLCDLTEFNGDVKCYIATGDCGGPHMWNIVVIDGTGYLVDVTNADVDDMEVDGTTYHLDSCLDEFFLMGQTLSSGKTYTARRPAKQFEIDGGTLTVGGGTLTYTYKNDMGFDVDLDLLNLSARDYAVLTGTPVIQKDGAAVSGTLVYAPGVTLTAVVNGGASGASYTYQWLKDGNAISGAASGTYALQEGDIGSSITVRIADRATEAFKVSQPVRIISSGPPTAANFTIADPGPGYLVYDGTVKTLTVTSNYGVTPTVSYRKDGRTVTEIRDAGTYQVFVTVPAHAGLEAASGLQIGEITVAKADVELDTVASLSLRPRESKSLFLTPPSLPSGMRLSFSPSSVRNVFTVNTTNGLVTAGTNETAEPVMVTVSVTGSNPNYNTPASKTVPVTVNNLPVPALTVNPLPNSIPVGGEATITVGASYQNSDGETVTVDSALISVSIDPDSAEIAEIKAGGKILGKQVGTARINVSLPASPDEYAANQTTAELTVTGMEITPAVTITPPTGGYVYKGEDWTAEDLDIAVTYTDGNGTHTLTEDDYTVELSGEDLMNAGSTVAVKVSPKGLNYSWMPVEDSFEIVKAPAPAVTLPDVQRHYDYAGADTFELASAPAIAQYAPTGYVLGEVADEDSVLSGPVTVSEEGVLSYTLARMTEAGVNKFAAVPVTIQSRNYKDFSVTVKIVRVALPKAEKFDSCTLTLTQNADGTYTASISPEAADAMYRFNGGAWSTERTLQVQGGQPITSAEIYRKGVQNESVDSDVTAADIGSGLIVPPGFTPNGGRFSGTQSVELHAMEADNVKIYYTTDGSEPYTPAEGEGEPQFGTEYTEAFSLSKTTTVKAVVIIYEEDGTTVQAVSETISKTFTRRSSASGGGGGGTTTPGTTPSAPSSTAKPTTTTKPSTPGVSNSSDATTAAPSATVKDGTASATVSGTIGKDLVDQAVANDSSTVVVAPSISGNPEKTEVTIGSSVVSDLSGRTNADLRVETPAADVTIPSRGLSGLAGRGGSLVVSTSSSGDTYHISVTAGGSTVERVTGGLTVSIPANCTYGTVAMLTKADGSTELIRKSVADAGTVRVPLEGSASITLLDNSKSFGDVPAGNTFAGAVAFVSSREIMNGTGTDTFNPNAPLTRAQLAKILHNLENNPAASASGSFSDVASGAWCAEAVQWAAAQGIVTGYADGTFRPNNYITREQLAVMLYRYAGSPSVRSSELRFSDASMVGGYAQTAMAWATQNGVINGKGGGMLDPKGQATRAQAAQMLFNFVRSAG